MFLKKKESKVGFSLIGEMKRYIESIYGYEIEVCQDDLLKIISSIGVNTCK